MAHNQRAPILKLPGELRNRIFRAVLIATEPIPMKHTTGPREPTFLAVCKQIRHEALDIWYEENDFSYEETPGTFGIFNISRLGRWLHRIGPERCAKLKKLVLTYQAPVFRRSNYGHCSRRGRRDWAAESFVYGLCKLGVSVDVVVVRSPRAAEMDARSDFRVLWREKILYKLQCEEVYSRWRKTLPRIGECTPDLDQVDVDMLKRAEEMET